MKKIIDEHLNSLGICRFAQRGDSFVQKTTDTSASSNDSAWLRLQERVSCCMACDLHRTRTQTVFGVGDQHARLMIIGEAPGFYEDKQGEPFVGRAGQLLTSMLKAVGFTREEVYIANILKCRPPENRDPTTAEVAACTGFLNQQIGLVQPKLLLAVGRIAAHYLLQTKASLESMRNKVHQYGNTPLIITYHPAYLLRNPIDKQKAFSDLLFMQRTLAAA
jgi:uracil-DNA glycosylase